DPMNGADVRMIESGCRARFSLEALEQTLITGHLRCQELQGDVTAEIGVFSFVNNSHPAFSKLSGDEIVRDGFPNHESTDYPDCTDRIIALCFALEHPPSRRVSAYCLLPTAYCLLPTAFCLLPSAFYLLPTAYCGLSCRIQPIKLRITVQER